MPGNAVTGNSLRATLTFGSFGIEGDPCDAVWIGLAGIGDFALMPDDFDVVAGGSRELALGRGLYNGPAGGEA